jgi:hypothetical protein
MRGFTLGGTAWDVTSHFPVFIYQHSDAFQSIIFLMGFLTLLTAVLHAGSRVSCYSFRSLCLCFNQRFNSGISWLFMSKSETLFVDSLYAKAVQTVKSAAALSASSFGLISSLGDIKSVERLWNCSQSVNFQLVLRFLTFNVIKYVEYYW